MRIIDWNNTLTFHAVFSDVLLKKNYKNYSGEYDNCKSDWICEVSNYFGSSPEAAERNLLSHFKRQVDALRCYHGTRLFFPHKIKREGLKIFSLPLIYKLCKQSKIRLDANLKEEIKKEYINLTSIDDHRKHIYVNIDRCVNIFDGDMINLDCSFLKGGEVFSSILPNKISSNFRNTLDTRGIPIVIMIDLPFNSKFISEQYLFVLARYFFHSWFHMKKTQEPQYKLDVGLNIPKKIPSSCIHKILQFKKDR